MFCYFRAFGGAMLVLTKKRRLRTLGFGLTRVNMNSVAVANREFANWHN